MTPFLAERPGRIRGQMVALVSLVLFGAITIAIGAWGAWSWSLVPTRIDERVATTSWSDDGPPFKVLDLAGGRILTIDSALYKRMGGAAVTGERVHKQRFDRNVSVGRRTVSLAPSSEFWKVASTLAVIVAVAVGRHLRRRQTDQRADRRRSTADGQRRAQRVATASS